MRKIYEAWCSFWFSPGSTLDLAILRIVAVALQLYLVMAFGFAGEVQSLSSLSEEAWQPRRIMRLMLLPFGGAQPDVQIVEYIWTLTVLAGALSLVGLLTNPSLMVFAAGSLFLQAFEYSFMGDLHHSDAAMLLALGAISLSPCGYAVSIDAFIERRRRNRPAPTLLQLASQKHEYAGWPIKLLFLLFALFYLSGAIAKLSYSGVEWANGITLQYFMATDGLRWGSDFGVWLSQFHYVALFASITVLVFQSTFFLTLIVPRLKWIYVPVGFVFHIMTYVTLFAPFFQWMALYVAFVPWSAGYLWWRRRATAGVRRGSLRPAEAMDP